MTAPTSVMDPADQAIAATWRHAVLSDGTPVLLRPLHPDDIELERRFIAALSPQQGGRRTAGRWRLCGDSAGGVQARGRR
ncbi:hypothetical protein BH11PSE7_BH11PSE7_17750 [soil metagenome]